MLIDISNLKFPNDTWYTEIKLFLIDVLIPTRFFIYRFKKISSIVWQKVLESLFFCKKKEKSQSAKG